MTDDTDSRSGATTVESIDRRTLLVAGATTGAILVAGCGAFEDVGDDDGEPATDGDPTFSDDTDDADDDTTGEMDDDGADDTDDAGIDDTDDDGVDDTGDDGADDSDDDGADDDTDDPADEDETDDESDGPNGNDEDDTDDDGDDDDDVTDDGDDDDTGEPDGEPTISLSTAPDESAEIGPLDAVDVTAEATDPGGNLESIVWYEGRNHTEIGRDPVSGDDDSVTRTFDEAPEWIAKGYPTMAYALTSDGRESEFDTSDGPTVRVPLEVTITETNSPVTAGEELVVTVTIENTGDMQLLGPTEQTFTLLVGEDREPVDSTTVDLVWAESTTEELSYETFPVASDTSFTLRVEGEDFADYEVVFKGRVSRLACARPGTWTLSVDDLPTDSPQAS